MPHLQASMIAWQVVSHDKAIREACGMLQPNTLHMRLPCFTRCMLEASLSVQA